jgi:hypothetical protein
MKKELYFECECGGKAKVIIGDLCDEENVFDIGTISQMTFECDECGKKYYCGDWEDFCICEDEL